MMPSFLFSIVSRDNSRDNYNTCRRCCQGQGQGQGSAIRVWAANESLSLMLTKIRSRDDLCIDPGITRLRLDLINLRNCKVSISNHHDNDIEHTRHRPLGAGKL